MKLTLSCILVTLLASIYQLLPAQEENPLLRQAQEAYERYHFKDAIPLFQEFLQSSPNHKEAEEQLAHSYRKLNDSRHAETWYAKIVQYPYADPSNKLFYAQALAMNGKYELSRKWYQAYAQEVRHDERGEGFAKVYRDTSHFHEDAANYVIRLAPFNSPEADFSPMFHRGDLVFCSNRNYKDSPFKLKFNWNGSNFLDLYVVKGRSGSPQPFHESLNGKYHEGPLAFYNGGRSVIFTRNNYQKGKLGRSSDGTSKLKLFLADVKGGDWENIREFPYNDDEYSVGHPTLSIDGTTLYFASDMPGTLGGTDIFTCNLENGYWSSPVNLGSNINTPGNEMFPYIDADNNLYYASDGQPGLGGLDVFVARNARGNFMRPQNMGVPINSNQDDFGLIIDVDRGEGYFSSNRTGGVGDDDIYWFRTQTCEVVFVVIDSLSGRYVKDADILVKERETQKQIVFVAENDSVYRFRPAFRSSYALEASSESLGKGQATVSRDMISECLSFDQGSSDTIKLFLKVPPLLAQKPPSASPPSGYNRPRRPVAYSGGDYPYPSSRFPPLVNYDSTQVFAIEYIYYDLDKYYIRPDAAATLQEVLAILYRYPEMRLLLSSHTDSRASYAYNVQLSRRRSRSAYQYLVNRGIDPRRLVLDHHGEQRLVTPCPDGVPCNEQEHQLNRRTEIVVLRE